MIMFHVNLQECTWNSLVLHLLSVALVLPLCLSSLSEFFCDEITVGIRQSSHIKNESSNKMNDQYL